jgi:hypothetical protein
MYELPTITVYAGRPYIAYGHVSGPTMIWGATSSTKTDGTWAQDAVFEKPNLTAGNATVEACIDALPSSGVIHVTIESTVPPAAFPQVGSYRYVAGVWQPYETIINTGAFGDNICSTVPWGNIMNVITNVVPGNNISHRQSSASGVWATAAPSVVISPGSYIQATVSIWNNTNGDLKCFFSAGLPNNISWKMYDNVLGAWDVGFFGLDNPATVNMMTSAQIHSSPLGVVYENDLAPDSDIVYYDYLDSFPPVPINYAVNWGSWLFVLIAIIVLALLVIIFGALGQGNMLENTLGILAVGIIISLAILLIMAIIYQQ